MDFNLHIYYNSDVYLCGLGCAELGIPILNITKYT